ncbi:MAG: hypothetical protein GX575_02445 [Candidatus Anammoximicrobium sp.]|nr:hypothetical protein [Candidatus Anammoximicrobium sp.]
MFRTRHRPAARSSATPLFASLVAKQTISSWISLVLNLYCGFADLTRGAENVQPSNPQ